MSATAAGSEGPAAPGATPHDRPAVSVIVPFRGDAADAREVVAQLQSIEVRAGDELILVDNTDDGVAEREAAGSAVMAVRATAEPSSYHARNVGAEHAANEWLLFMDADCRPAPRLLDEYFAEPVPERAGAVAGEVLGADGQDSTVARYARSRRHLVQRDLIEHPYKPLGVTANLLVRREAWADVGGFLEGIRSAGDSDFCWRLQDRGWEMAYRERASVEHRHRETLRALARQMARYGAGRRWLSRRHPGSRGRPRPVRDLLRCVAGVAVWTLTGRFERARFKALDAVAVSAEFGGYLLANTPPSATKARFTAGDAPKGTELLDLVVFVDSFPLLSETFIVTEVQALLAAGHRVRIESGSRAARPNRTGARGIPVAYIEDDGIARRLGDLAWLVVRHPLACARDVGARLRWRREEPVRALASLAPVARRLAAQGRPCIHAHFAAGAALDAMRLSRLLGLPYAVTAHAYDIFQFPRNLREKLEGAQVVATGCRYNVEYLRGVVGPEHRDKIHEIVMGVDGSRFERRTPYPGGRSVLAVGRLVEKKGFGDLIEAASLLAASGAVDAVRIVGEGPLQDQLAAQIHARGLEGTVELLGARDPDAVRDLLERADVLAMPCVVAADGDRDSMPVVVKEALAMEVPVVASDEVGLPEVVREDWGRLVPPRDPRALAHALAVLLELPADERAAMGRAGRDFVLEHCSAEREAEKLARLLLYSTNVR